MMYRNAQGHDGQTVGQDTDITQENNMLSYYTKDGTRHDQKYFDNGNNKPCLLYTSPSPRDRG